MLKKLLLGIVSVCVLCACSSHDDVSSGTKAAIFAFPGVGEEGIYHNVRTTQYPRVYFYDFKNDVDVPLCSKVNCNHDNADCDAFKLSYYKNKEITLRCDPIPFGDTLYLIYEEPSFGIAYLCSSKLDGSERKELLKFAKNSIIESAMFFQDSFYYTLNTFEVDEKGNKLQYAYNYSSYVFNLKDGSSQKIPGKKAIANRFMGTLQDKAAIMRIDGKNKNSVGALYTLEKDNKLKLIEDTYKQKNSFLVEDHYYDFDTKTSTIYTINPVTHKADKLMQVKLPKGYQVGSVNTTNFAMMEIRLIKDKRYTGSLWIDLDEKTVVETKKPFYVKADQGYFVQNEDQTLTRIKK